MIYAVIDTNVLVSALITHNSLSPTAKVVRLLHFPQTPKVISPADFLSVIIESKEGDKTTFLS
jgi:predicted nucleic acid-binding protein